MSTSGSEQADRGGPESPIGAAWSRPTLIAAGCLVILAALGWLYLGLMVATMAGSGGAAALGPGMGLFDLVLGSGTPDGLAEALLQALCRPAFGHNEAAPSAAGIALTAVMWAAMALAMMLPTAGPMVLAYADVADRAARKGESAGSPLALIAGYTGVWLGFAVVAAMLQVVLARAALLDPAMASASPLFSGAVFIAAGAYQFSALKLACVTQCQRPLPFFLRNGSGSTATVFRLGLRQGRFCLGCCWAMMLLMFAVGTMNIVWMALLGVVMGAEKAAATTRFSKIIGVVFVAVGVWLIAAAVAAHWPAAAA